MHACAGRGCRGVSAATATEDMASAHALQALLLLFLYAAREAACLCDNASAVGAQVDALLASYERDVPPPGTRPLRVQLALDLRHATIDDDTATARLLADLHMSWQDSRLAWNATEWGCEWAAAAAERLWLPDVTAVNAAGGAEPLRARLDSAGAVAWAARLDLTLPLDIDLTDWPNDVQLAQIKFASREFSRDELDFTIKETQYATVFESGSWEIASVSGELSSVRAEEGAAWRRVARWRLALRRRAPAQAAAARVVLAAAVLTLVASALLPPDARVPVAAIAALMLAVWLCCAAWRVPAGGGQARALAGAGGACAACGAAAACAALAARLARHSSPPPRLVRSLVAAGEAFWVFAPPVQGTSGEGAGAGGESGAEAGAGAWAGAARLLDAVLLATLGLALLLLLALTL